MNRSIHTHDGEGLKKFMKHLFLFSGLMSIALAGCSTTSNQSNARSEQPAASVAAASEGKPQPENISPAPKPSSPSTPDIDLSRVPILQPQKDEINASGYVQGSGSFRTR